MTLRAQSAHNIYAYVGGNPVSYVDPLGLRALTDCESGILSKYFPNKDLSKIDIKDDIPTSRRRGGAEGADAWTFKSTIYMPPGIDAPNTVGGISLIGHEIVHSMQYDQYGVIGMARRYNAAYKANIKMSMSEYDLAGPVRGMQIGGAIGGGVYFGYLDIGKTSITGGSALSARGGFDLSASIIRGRAFVSKQSTYKCGCGK